MKNRGITFVFISLLAMAAVAQEPIELITYNIRMNTTSDGEHAWPYRKDDVAALIRFHRADIFCVQEALPEQMDDLDAAFPLILPMKGIGRDDGKRQGEFSAVFYNQEPF